MDKIQENLVKVFASFIVGYSSAAPGTLGTLAGIPLYLFLYTRGTKIYVIFTILFFILGLEISSLAETIFKKKDSQKIVIDEISGFLVTMLFVPYKIQFIILGFTLFRIIDIWKPYPVYLFQNLEGGIGIMSDDLMAGIYSNIILQVVTRFNFLP
ncbi:MAG: phosphatidylglycerophosphatase A [bacterium]